MLFPATASVASLEAFRQGIDAVQHGFDTRLKNHHVFGELLYHLGRICEGPSGTIQKFTLDALVVANYLHLLLMESMGFTQSLDPLLMKLKTALQFVGSHGDILPQPGPIFTQLT